MLFTQVGNLWVGNLWPLGFIRVREVHTKLSNSIGDPNFSLHFSFWGPKRWVLLEKPFLLYGVEASIHGFLSSLMILFGSFGSVFFKYNVFRLDIICR